MSSLIKPELRGHLKRYLTKAILGSVALAFVNMGVYYFCVAQPRKKRYEEFHKTYDAEAHIEALSKTGYLQSTQKSGDI